MTLRPCLRCGEPSPRSHCDEHRPKHPPKSPREYGYDAAWDRLSRRARRLQPWCSGCGSTEGLQCDHKPSAWARKAEGKAVRLQDVDVLCGPCNRAAGAARGNAVTRGNAPQGVKEAPVPKAEFELLSAPLFPVNGDLPERINGGNIRLDGVGQHDRLGGKQHVAEGADHVVVGDVVAEDASERVRVHCPAGIAGEVRGEQRGPAIEPSVQDVSIHDRSLS